MRSSNFLHQYLRVIVVAALLAGQAFPADNPRPRSSGLELLIQKARSLEARDRADLAAQVWQQVLVANPSQPDALASLARWAKRAGRSEEANAYLARLRRVSPDAQALTQLDPPDAAHGANTRLEEAGKLAANGHPEDAMRIYREVFGSAPPPGGWAVAYYTTLANTSGGFEPAVAALRNLAASYPDVPSYRLAAGTLLTYRPATRQAGIALLSAIGGTNAAATKAREAWRQALIWEKTNPAYQGSMALYLSRYSDSELQTASNTIGNQVAKVERVTPESREERLGYAALKEGKMADAEAQFSSAVTKDDKNGRAHAGLGFVRMKAGDFNGAVQQFEAAHKADPGDATVKNSLASARFWQAMREGASASDVGDWNKAIAQYQAALAQNAHSEEAMRALGGAFLAAGQPDKALPYLASAVRSKNADSTTWCAFVTAKLDAEGGKAALAAMHSVSPATADVLAKKPAWKALEVSALADAGDEGHAEELFRDLTASQPVDLTAAEQVQLGGLALHFGQPAQALAYSRKAVELDEKSPGAWEVLLSSLTAAQRPQEAERVAARVPESLKKTLNARPGYLEALATMKESANDLDRSRLLLEQVIALPETRARRQSQLPIKLHLAEVLAKCGRGVEAETLVNSVADANPDNAEVWRARFVVLQALNRQSEIASLAAGMPGSVAVRIGTQADMVTLLARAHDVVGNNAFGVKLLETYISRSGAANGIGAVPQRIQLGWLLLNSPGDGDKLYAVLDALNSRASLTDNQRREVDDLWATWIMRSSEAARRAGDEARSLGLLEQGMNMFPQNPKLQRAFAGNLLAAGKTKRALNVYSNWGLAGAEPDDYAGAIGAALAEKNTQYADAWIDRGLQQWPAHPKLLEMAGERAKSRGDLKRAEMYWKEALAQKAAQPAEALASSETGAQPSLKSLLVQSSGRKQNSRFGSDMAVVSNGAQTPQVHLSSFSGESAPREDYVRGNGFLGGEPLVARRSNQPMLLAKAVLPAAAEENTLQDKITSLDSRNTPYIGSRMSVWGRGGESGFSRLITEQAEFEASATLANSLRASFLLKPTYLSGGTASGSGNSLFGRQTSVASFGQQTASGLGAEAQLSSNSFGLRLGVTPQGFLTSNWMGGLRIQPKQGPITILLERDNVKDTMLAYSGARDPLTGNVWGGVMANTASLQGRWGDSNSGFYASGGYQSLDGRNVARNTGVNGNFGTWWKVAALPTGSLTVGTNFSAMHYNRNLRYFTYGQGGYFSPQQYFLFNVPVRWTGNYNRRLQYIIGGSLGLQHFVEDASDFYPTDAALQARTNFRYAGLANTGANFGFDARLNYQLAPHWIAGLFATASNARNYTASSAGLFVRYTFQERPMSFENAIPSVPDWRGQQPFLLY